MNMSEKREFKESLLKVIQDAIRLNEHEEVELFTVTKSELMYRLKRNDGTYYFTIRIQERY